MNLSKSNIDVEELKDKSNLELCDIIEQMTRTISFYEDNLQQLEIAVKALLKEE